jgi:hypothetical protein
MRWCPRAACSEPAGQGAGGARAGIRRPQEDPGAPPPYRRRYRRPAVGNEPDDRRDRRFNGAQLVLDALQQRWPWLEHLFGDAAHDRKTLMDKAGFINFTVEVVRELEGQQGFAVQPAAGWSSAPSAGPCGGTAWDATMSCASTSRTT